MTRNKFIKELFIAILASLISVVGLNFILEDKGDWPLSWIAIAFFTLLSILIFYFGDRSAKSDDKYMFVRIILMNVMFKIIACFGLVAIYYKLYNPSSRFFVLPFLMVYLIFTVFETYCLIRQSKTVKN